MTKTNFVLVVVAVTFVCIAAAPSDFGKRDLEKSVDQISQQKILSNSHKEDETNVRRKRHQNFYDYAAISRFQYSNVPNGFENSNFFNILFSQIQKQFDQISNFIRPSSAYSPNPLPIFVPSFYIPNSNCNCYPTNVQATFDNSQSQIIQDLPPTNTDYTSADVSIPVTRTDIRQPTATSTAKELSTTAVSIIDDKVRTSAPIMTEESSTVSTSTTNSEDTVSINFGENESDDDYEELGTRPISFEPIRINNQNARPAPPVDRGSTQEDSQNLDS